MNDLISVIIPCYKGAKYIGDAINGIKKQNMDVEIIVVDDCSPDNSAEIAESLGCRVVRHNTNKGPVVAKNTGLGIASGNFIMFHDADDVMEPNSLSILYDRLSADNSYFAIMAKVRDFVSPDIEEDEKKKNVIREDAYYGLFTGAVLMRRSVWDIIGKFDESVTAGEIIDWQNKMDRNALSIKKIDFISCNRRIHTTNFGKTQQKKEYTDYATLLRMRMKK